MALIEAEKIKIEAEEKLRISQEKLRAAKEKFREDVKKDFHTTPKKFVAGIIIFVSIMAIIFSLPNNPNTKTDKTEISTQTSQSTQQMQEDFITFYKEFMKVANRSDKTNNVILSDLEAFRNGNISKGSLYLQVKDVEKIQGQLSRALPQVPNSLKQYKEDLQKAESDMSTAIFERRESMKHLAEYLNTGDLEKFRKGNENIQYQQAFMLDAVASLLSVAVKLGVDTNSIKVE